MVFFNPFADMGNGGAGKAVARFIESEVERCGTFGEFAAKFQVLLGRIPDVVGGRDMQHVGARVAVVRILAPVTRDPAADRDAASHRAWMGENETIVVSTRLRKRQQENL